MSVTCRPSRISAPASIGPRREPPHHPRRLQRGVGRMTDRGREAAREWASRGIDPLGLEPVGPERFDLVAQVLPLLGIGGETKAPEPPERVTRELAHRLQLRLCPLPERQCLIAPERGDDLVVRRRCPAERETAVAAARTLGDLARIDDADSKTRFRQLERARAPRHAGAHDPDVHRSAPGATRKLQGRLGEPVRTSSRDRTAHHPLVHRHCTGQLEQRERRCDLARADTRRAAQLVRRSRSGPDRVQHRGGDWIVRDRLRRSLRLETEGFENVRPSSLPESPRSAATRSFLR